MRFHVALLCAATILTVGASTGQADDEASLDVFPRVTMAPATLKVRAFVPPDAANRALRIVADSGNFYRSSLIQLDGADAASVTETTLKNLPGGDYEIVAVLHDTTGARTIDRRRVIVTGR
jgi:hypothetical protein